MVFYRAFAYARHNAANDGHWQGPVEAVADVEIFARLVQVQQEAG